MEQMARFRAVFFRENPNQPVTALTQEQMQEILDKQAMQKEEKDDSKETDSKKNFKLSVSAALDNKLPQFDPKNQKAMFATEYITSPEMMSSKDNDDDDDESSDGTIECLSSDDEEDSFQSALSSHSGPSDKQSHTGHLTNTSHGTLSDSAKELVIDVGNSTSGRSSGRPQLESELSCTSTNTNTNTNTSVEEKSDISTSNIHSNNNNRKRPLQHAVTQPKDVIVVPATPISISSGGSISISSTKAVIKTPTTPPKKKLKRSNVNEFESFSSDDDNDFPSPGPF